MKKILFATLVLSLAVGCGKEKDKKAKVGAKMRTTGVSDTLLHLIKDRMSLAGQTVTASSSIELDSLKVPITRVNLVSDLVGSGYQGASPNFYTCPEDSDCLVDLVDDSLDNLLQSDGAGEVKVDEDKAYNGVAVEFCKDGKGGEENNFNVVVKGKVTLGTTVYYTNAAAGLAVDGPAEELSIPAMCHGFTTPLPQEVTLGPSRSVNIVLWADPSGMVAAATEKGALNAYCVGEGPAICTGFTSIFTTVDDAKPTVERYMWDVTTQAEGKSYADMLMTILFNSNDDPIGASLTQIYTNKEEVISMHGSPSSFSRIAKAEDGTITFKIWNQNMELTDFMTGFPRETKEGLTIKELVNEEMTFNSTKLP